ncbi:hypothetical protein C8R44DRAFT_755379 [Mycena epipterygia]|nr:hypothetical protein C8R44DRAFT_755379 [Mycena epipterygia]
MPCKNRAPFKPGSALTEPLSNPPPPRPIDAVFLGAKTPKMSISIAGNIPEAERVKILRDLSRLTIDNPPAAQEGYANIRPYKPKGAGWVYVEINADEVVIEGRRHGTRQRRARLLEH